MASVEMLLPRLRLPRAWDFAPRTQTRAAELLLMPLLLAVALVAHGLNMFSYPLAYGDEGIYMAQALSVLREARLAPYTYWYDHAPAGWFLIAGWLGLTGGPLTFGDPIDSGRMLMLLLHLAMVPLLYRMARKLSGSIAAGALAALLFSLSPLAVFYQRLVLLDTIMLFWVMLSIELLLDGWGRLSRLVLSGVCFGIAALSKETAVFLLPAMLLLTWQQRRAHHGRFALLGWLVPMLLVLSLYPLFALLKHELLPAGQAIGFAIFSIRSDHGVSLIDSLKWQATRSGGSVFSLDSMFWQLVREDWLPRDPLLLAGGALASGLNLLRGLRERRALLAGLFGLLPLFYLARGGIVFDFYILLALPFLCLNIALLAAWLAARSPRAAASALIPALLLAALASYLAAGSLRPLYAEQPDLARREAVAWLKQHAPAGSRIVVRDDIWPDLHEPGLGGPAFPHAHSHWKVASDPMIRDGVFHGDWRRVDFLVLTPEMRRDFEATGNTIALEALAHARNVASWTADGAQIEIWQVEQK
jgi:4-amino-4-deoxy-L-arabinose transferase-like glycosyltransferase